MNDMSSSSSLSYKFHPSNVLPIRSIHFRRLESAFFSEFSSTVTAFAMTSSATRARHANGKCLNEPRGIIFLSLQFRVRCVVICVGASRSQVGKSFGKFVHARLIRRHARIGAVGSGKFTVFTAGNSGRHLRNPLRKPALQRQFTQATIGRQSRTWRKIDSHATSTAILVAVWTQNGVTFTV